MRAVFAIHSSMCRKTIVRIRNESDGIGRANCDNPLSKLEIAGESVDLDSSCVRVHAHVIYFATHHLDDDNQNLCADAIKRSTNALV